MVKLFCFFSRTYKSRQLHGVNKSHLYENTRYAFWPVCTKMFCFIRHYKYKQIFTPFKNVQWHWCYHRTLNGLNQSMNVSAQLVRTTFSMFLSANFDLDSLIRYDMKLHTINYMIDCCELLMFTANDSAISVMLFNYCLSQRH